MFVRELIEAKAGRFLIADLGLLIARWPALCAGMLPRAIRAAILCKMGGRP